MRFWNILGWLIGIGIIAAVLPNLIRNIIVGIIYVFAFIGSIILYPILIIASGHKKSYRNRKRKEREDREDREDDEEE